MLPVLAQTLLGDDATLFSEGACHIFADELYNRLATHGFRFRRLDDTNMVTREGRALHVYLGNHEQMVDVKGIRGERDFIDEMFAIRAEGVWVSNLKPF